jgi:hypothetical protein
VTESGYPATGERTKQPVLGRAGALVPAWAQLWSGTGSRVPVVAVDSSGGQASLRTRLASVSTTAGSNWEPAQFRSSATAWVTGSWDA